MVECQTFGLRDRGSKSPSIKVESNLVISSVVDLQLLFGLPGFLFPPWEDMVHSYHP